MAGQLKVDGVDQSQFFIEGVEQAIIFNEGRETWRKAGINLPTLPAIGRAPRYALLGATVAGGLQLSATPIPVGETVTLHREDGTLVAPTTPGNWVINPAPATSETFLFTATNAAGETLVRRWKWNRVTLPSWRNAAVTRISEAPGVSITDLYRLTAEVFGEPKPTLTLRGDAWFSRALGRVDLNRHLSGSSDPYSFSLNVSVNRAAGHGFHQAATIRATVTADDETAGTSDQAFSISIPGA